MTGKLYIDGVYIGECENTTISQGEIVRSQEIPIVPTEAAISFGVEFTYVNVCWFRCARIAHAIMRRHAGRLN